MSCGDILNVIELEQARRKKKDKAPQESSVDQAAIGQAVCEFASLPELEYAAQKKAKAKELGLALSVLDNLVSKKRRGQFCGEDRDFQLLADGLYRVDDYSEPFDRLTSSFTVEGQCRNPEGRGYALMLGVQTPEGSTSVILPRSFLAGDGKEAIKLLLDAGLCLTQTDGAQRMLVRYLVAVRAESTIQQVDTPGWHGEVYVTPQGNFPPEEKSIIYGGEDVQGLEFTQKGTLPEWQTHVAAPAFANPYLLLFICAAFAAILMPIVSFTSFILNLVGKSSSGKTTSLRLGNSVFGPPSRIKNWRATDNAMEWLAAAWNHALLCLDEMKQCAVQVLGKSIYMLGNEQGKERATRSGGTRKSKVWSLIAGSTSEVTSTDLLRSIGEEPMAGQEVRTIDVVISERTPHGVFHTLHGDKSGADLSDRLQRNVRQYHGTAAPAFISKVQAEGFEAVGKQVMPIVERFEAEYLPASADGQVHRVCARFGLLAAAGELASRWGVTGWPQGHAYQAIGSIFNEWLSDRGGVGAREEQKIIDQVTYYIEKYGCSRFEPLDPLTFGEYRQTPAQRAGYYRIDGGDGSMHHYVFAQTFKTEFCTGYSPKLVIKVLSEAGILKASTSQVIKDPGKKTIRVYHLVDVIAHIGDRETGGELS